MDGWTGRSTARQPGVRENERHHARLHSSERERKSTRVRSHATSGTQPEEHTWTDVSPLSPQEASSCIVWSCETMAEQAVTKCKIRNESVERTKRQRARHPECRRRVCNSVVCKTEDLQRHVTTGRCQILCFINFKSTSYFICFFLEDRYNIFVRGFFQGSYLLNTQKQVGGSGLTEEREAYAIARHRD